MLLFGNVDGTFQSGVLNPDGTFPLTWLVGLFNPAKFEWTFNKRIPSLLSASFINSILTLKWIFSNFRSSTRRFITRPRSQHLITGLQSSPPLFLPQSLLKIFLLLIQLINILLQLLIILHLILKHSLQILYFYPESILDRVGLNRQIKFIHLRCLSLKFKILF